MKAKKRKMKRSRANLIFDTVNMLIMLFVVVIMLYPMWFVLIASFSDPNSVSLGKVILLPDRFTLYSYINVMSADRIWTGYANTIFNTLLGTLWNLFLTVPCAYTLSKKKLPGRGFLSMLFVFTMYFGGGMIPSYLNVKRLNLLDNRWTLVVLGGITVSYIIIVRTYFQSSIPQDLYEAAIIDGASDFQQFFKVALPLSGPVVAVITLYYAVNRWNDYFTALVYLNDVKLMPLQMVLRDVLINNETLLNKVLMDPSATSEQITDLAKRVYMAEGMKYAIVFVASLPMLILYPFVQKYFVKGAMIGSLKG